MRPCKITIREPLIPRLLLRSDIHTLQPRTLVYRSGWMHHEYGSVGKHEELRADQLVTWRRARAVRHNDECRQKEGDVYKNSYHRGPRKYSTFVMLAQLSRFSLHYGKSSELYVDAKSDD